MARYIDVKKELEIINRQLENLEHQLQGRLQVVPEGSLIISKVRNQVKYYQSIYKSGKESRQYLREENSDIIKALAQKEYDNQLIRATRLQQKAVARFLSVYNMDRLKEIYANLSPERKQLIKADIVDDEEYARQWQERTYEPGEFDKDAPEFYTLKNERVRSKTEKIIADTFCAADIPYHYEYPNKMANGKIWRPDFHVLNKRTREEFFHEHLGRMDDIDYCNRAIKKIQIYMQNGYFPGERLILTAETSQQPFSTKDLDLIIKKYYT